MSEGPVGLSEAALLAIAAGQLRLQILALCEQGSRTATEISGELAAKRSTVLYHLQELERAGLVAETGREPISGGPLISYGATGSGWAEVIAAANRAAQPRKPS